MNHHIPDDKLALIKDAIFQYQKILAIKHYREVTGEGLKDCKDAMDQLEEELRKEAPERFMHPAKSGCMGVLRSVGAVLDFLSMR